MIGDGSLPLDIVDDRVDHASNNDGWGRSLSVEWRGEHSDGNTVGSRGVQWLTLRAMLDTPNHGLLSLDASTNTNAYGRTPPGTRSKGPTKTHFTLNQRQVPLAGGVVADHALGLHVLGGLPILRSQSRIGLPSRTVLGVSGAWSSLSGDWYATAGTGDASSVDHGQRAGLNLEDQRLTTAGIQWRLRGTPEDGWHYGIQAGHAKVGPDSMNWNSPLGDSLMLMQTLRYSGSDRLLQLNMLGTREAGQKWRNGFWTDSAWRSSMLPIEHRLGLNSLPNRQRWLATPIASGTRGGYYRWRWQEPLLTIDTQLDRQHYTTEASAAYGASTAKATQFFVAARQADPMGNAWGTQVTALQTDRTRTSALVFREMSLPDIDGRWRVFGGHANTGTQRRHVGVDISGQNAGWRFNGNVGLEFVPKVSGPGSDLGIGVGRSEGAWSLDASLRRYGPAGGGTPGQVMNLSLSWRVAPGWTLSGTASRHLGSVSHVPSSLVGSAPLLPGFEPVRTRMNHAWLTLRYDFSSGHTPGPIGGIKGSGSGSIEGFVFLDKDGNGRMDPGEERAKDVTVVLDGRYGIKTDSNGRYEFPHVSPGEHRVRVQNDNLPLPWSMASESDRAVRVELRSISSVSFGASRQ